MLSRVFILRTYLFFTTSIVSAGKALNCLPVLHNSAVFILYFFIVIETIPWLFEIHMRVTLESSLAEDNYSEHFILLFLVLVVCSLLSKVIPIRSYLSFYYSYS